MKKLKVAVVGVGIYGVNHVRAYKANDLVELIAVCDVSKNLADKIAAEYNVKAYYSVEDMLSNEELDVVSIATPDCYHLDPALSCIRKGIHVLIEKPLATDSDECRTIVKEAKKYGVKVGVDFHKRWDPASIQIKNELNKESSGDIIRGYMNMDDIIDVPTKWFNWADKSSPAHFLGIHCYDLIRWYVGCEAKEVYAVGNKTVLSNMGIDTYDSIQAIITFENGCNWVVENSWIYPSTFPKANDGRTSILTSKTLIRCNSQDRGLEIIADKIKTPNSYFLNESDGRPFGFGIEPINDFVYCVINNKEYKSNAIDGLEATKITEAVHKSLVLGKSVTIEREEYDI